MIEEKKSTSVPMALAAHGGTPGYEVVGSAASETLADTHYYANSFTGWGGDDTLMGGGGDTTYHFNRGDGKDNLIDLAGQDTLAFGPGITAANIRFAYESPGDYSPGSKSITAPLMWCPSSTANTAPSNNSASMTARPTASPRWPRCKVSLPRWSLPLRVCLFSPHGTTR